MRRSIPLLGLGLTLLLGCGSEAAGTGAQRTETPEPVAVSAPEPERWESPDTAGRIPRADLLLVLDAGLGRFLQGVRTEPHLEGGAFVGFRVHELWPNDRRFADLPLAAGDTVTHVNASPIERPEQALAVWNELRVASELVVTYLHDGQEHELRYAIVD
ncbi:MAG TPA: hypothetical protein RMH85_31295 [Polyangiaceae bacterium LLY-WYZ-15_(1-7)]|nr:hypothetical protein [Sandaracinus sp.]HJL05160.1 hypothetical protein [Polyangiaceae bacterium LLY-WYZ-15_(1-7)]MBJ71808.1 hypothetical protein [Sandaracinus sp.]HJL13011.1 hypothetical protein [Polyangiaceae bacterium LLY-WYZ-15_(1-7)]HJL22851.1 hypothetical protein [Polyangiaceae bacterium LLY-WYZ-15_(1-7)]